MTAMKPDSEKYDSLSDLPPSKEEFVYEVLKEAILSGQLAPGDSLVQTELAERMGVSHIPIRGAIKQLAAQGLVVQRSYRSPQVSELTDDGLEEILVIRMHLEVLATRKAVMHLQTEELAELHNLVDEMDEALAGGELHAYGSLNKQFHLTVYGACPYPLLRQMIEDLWSNSERFRSRAMFVLVPSLAKESHSDHRRFLALVEAGELEDAVDLMERHKNRARSAFVRTLQQANCCDM